MKSKSQPALFVLDLLSSIVKLWSEVHQIEGDDSSDLRFCPS